MKRNTIIHGDCLEHLRGIPDESVDVTFADPALQLKEEIQFLSRQS